MKTTSPLIYVFVLPYSPPECGTIVTDINSKKQTDLRECTEQDQWWILV